MKRLTLLLFSAATMFAGSAAASGPPSSATVLIRHQLQHCHAWSFNGGAFLADTAGTIAKGGTITFTNNDVMPHALYLRSGLTPRFLGSPALKHMGASIKVVFPKAGVYVFGTRAGEDYFKGVKTIGEDNVLVLTVVVK